MKQLILLAILFGGCVTATEPTPVTEYTYTGSGELVTGSFHSPVRATTLHIKDSTGSVVMVDSDGQFVDSLFHVKVERISDHGLRLSGEVYGEQSYGTFTLVSSDNILNGSYCTGSGTTRYIWLKKQ